MPTRTYECSDCLRQEKRLVSPGGGPIGARPCTCGGEMNQIQLGPTGSTVMEKLDNGAMPRAIERPVNAPALYQERAQTGRG